MSLISNPEFSLINGQSHSSKQQVDVINPATGESITQVSEADNQAADIALQAAAETFETLSNLTAHTRSKVLRKWYELVVEYRQALAEIVTKEQGKPLKEALAEADYAAGFIEWYSEEAKRAYGQVIPSHSQSHTLTTIRQGVGVVLGITPWNFPLAMITRKVAPAYAAGCSFILKPSEKTPLAAIALAKLAIQAGMEVGAFQVLVTNDSKGLVAHLTQSPQVRKLTFTGSTQVGSALLKQCADTVKRTSMELGGNAPFIIFDSADIEQAISGLMAAKFRNAGQTCVAANRVFVAQGIAADFTDKLSRQVEQLKVGNGFEEGVDIGPLISIEAKQKAQRLLEDALAKGANIAYQGDNQAGQFMAPVVITGVDNTMALFHEEIFAPIVSIISFEQESEAVKMANAVPEGLAAYFYSNEVNQIRRVSAALEYGMVGINEGIISNPVAPFGGVKFSGLGREGAQEGLSEYQEIKYLCQKFY
ncbi:NAD-dependent succinate-semialdehyde dehydrogenase [Pseudoalteromonas peptidolytica]|uniref:Succinate-semialdehyde dehydrogenase / glutarate-semialdehyde dehydrogenase n=1 Tax=Pseudoalteromonas peptidolytica F12-50-A1 TaxID=1315280 RepID=A0A8I0T3F0_9GAMM|nr:NAD-dependent succinate-semialdehyde dehydrogenase [Pseudoalteromonas peptidolytica]MBE0345167.1 succinate-semialdehyde dehydrogenase / glutarate-semialdehyde dehydrogenase [Pseudoalteromonas peptidolytica F12-50-A1]NLR14841.1 NAD-dependent succinate-semialdehyde dehydrogenase [Pseudoalteromonas peptidolytica]GEK09785.1 NAD-dependent succinate-semialdehyde dehydrogenase [Pseudoalteromonas peptidolytica]